MRVAPKVWIGFAVAIGYIVLVTVVQTLGGVPYTEWGASAWNLFFGADLSLVIATVALVVVTSALGWWGPVLRERQRSRHRWTLIAPAILALIAVVGLIGSQWSAVSAAFFGAALLLLLVGFTEEIVYRGILPVALRSRVAEVWVWLISTAAFALMHLSNSLLGQPIQDTLPQVASTFSIGSIFYVLRRASGSILPAMALHALWDFSVFIQGTGTVAPFARYTGALLFPAIVLGLIAVFFVVRGPHERTGTTPHVERNLA